MGNRRIFLISLMQSCYQVFKDGDCFIPKKGSPAFLRQSVELGFHVQHKLGNSKVEGVILILTGLESALITNEAPKILSSCCLSEARTPPGRQGI